MSQSTWVEFGLGSLIYHLSFQHKECSYILFYLFRNLLCLILWRVLFFFEATFLCSFDWLGAHCVKQPDHDLKEVHLPLLFQWWDFYLPSLFAWGHVCLCVCSCAHACVWKPEINVSVFSHCLPRALCYRWIGQPARPRDPPVSTSSALRFQEYAAELAFYMGAGELNSGPHT